LKPIVGSGRRWSAAGESARRPHCKETHMKTTTSVLIALMVVLAVSGCDSMPKGGNSAYRCYDSKGKLAPTVTTQGECEAYTWEWRAY
jgi:hypothetical protein